jgi:hypothetical protein
VDLGKPKYFNDFFRINSFVANHNVKVNTFMFQTKIEMLGHNVGLSKLHSFRKNTVCIHGHNFMHTQCIDKIIAQYHHIEEFKLSTRI